MHDSIIIYILNTTLKMIHPVFPVDFLIVTFGSSMLSLYKQNKLNALLIRALFCIMH